LLLVNARQFQTQAGRNFLRDLVLHVKNIREFADILLAPNMLIGLGVVHPNSDDNLVADLFDAARQHGADVQLAADFVCVLLFAL